LVNVDKALQLRGIHSSGAVYYPWLAEQASTRKLIAEVGSWMGGSARAMADNTSGTVYCIDPWTVTPEMYGDSDYQAHKADPNWLFDGFTHNMEGLTNYRAVRMLSVQAAEFVKNQGLKFDMIFIDACHEYESVKQDILAWRPLLADGGLFCGHDWGFQGVTQAVTELIPGAYPVGADSIWRAA
jgi:predicted O-methyltransferase YrrM